MEVLTEEQLREGKKENFLAALQQTNGKIYGSGGTAELLAIKPTTLLPGIKKMGIKRVGKFSKDLP